MSPGQQEGQGSAGGRLHPAAYRELQAGEIYEPYVPAGAAVPEFTVRSVTLGILMVLVFSVALFIGFDRSSSGMQFEEFYSWIPTLSFFRK